ncbi:hypothetical protein CHU98_g7321 [Xylaria longipes]|nr:hypothetical protein CHU98_g7321 [Xylaria longipes]
MVIGVVSASDGIVSQVSAAFWPAFPPLAKRRVLPTFYLLYRAGAVEWLAALLAGDWPWRDERPSCLPRCYRSCLKMRSSTIFASILAFAASALAQDATPGYAVVSAPGKGAVVPSGKTYNIKWSAGKFSGPATISLMGGNDPTTLEVLDPIATGVDVKSESFAWAVACSLGEQKTYGLKITDQATNGATFQYSFPFEIKGPSCNSASSTSSISASASATASASGYPTEPETTSQTKASGYPVETSSSSTSSSTSTSVVSASTIVSSSIISNTTTVKSSTSFSIPATTLATQTTKTTPVVYVTETSTPTGSSGSGSSSSASSSIPASSTTSHLPTATAGATRAGAGLALGLLAAALAL